MSAILLFTDDVSLAEEEIARFGGRILHVLTPSVIVAELSEDVALVASTRIRPAGLDEASARLADAWEASRSKKTPTEVLPWDAPGREPPA